MFVLYEDDPNYDTQFFNVCQEKGEYLYIRHDQDIYEEDVLNEDGSIKYNAGDYKKPHVHFVLKLKNPSTPSALAKRVGIDANDVEIIKKSFNGALKYLIHYNLDNKYQYDKSEVKGTDKLQRKFLDLVSDDISEVQKVSDIQDYIESFQDFIDLGVLGRYVQKINMWDAFRRNMMYFCKLVDNHNARIASKYYHNEENPYYVATNALHSDGLHNIYYAIFKFIKK